MLNSLSISFIPLGPVLIDFTGLEVSVSASVLPMNSQDWFPLGWTGWISLLFPLRRCQRTLQKTVPTISMLRCMFIPLNYLVTPVERSLGMEGPCPSCHHLSPHPPPTQSGKTFCLWAALLKTHSSVQLLSRVRLFVTPWIAVCQASLSITNSRSSFKLTSIESVMPSSHLILCRPLLLLLPTPPSISLFQWVNSSHEAAKVLEFQL